jgi:hypothetical protein
MDYTTIKKVSIISVLKKNIEKQAIKIILMKIKYTL